LVVTDMSKSLSSSGRPVVALMSIGSGAPAKGSKPAGAHVDRAGAVAHFPSRPSQARRKSNVEPII
jgi:hypothetical protein